MKAKILVGLLVGLASLSANAFYASLSPPTGWVVGTGPFAPDSGAGGLMRGALANAQASSRFTNSVTKIPVALKHAPGAARIAARALAASPLALGVTGAAWLATECIGREGGSWVLTCGGDAPTPSDGYEYITTIARDAGGALAIWHSNSTAACVSGISLLNAQGGAWTYVFTRVNNSTCNANWFRRDTGAPGFQDEGALIFEKRTGGCAIGWYSTPAGCVQNPPPVHVTQTQVEEKMAPKSIPPGLPQEIPNTPLPIELPIINPTPGTNPQPQPQPLIIPQGEPVKIPNTDPQKYSQPTIRVRPSPTTEDPWRVDVTPEDVISESPTGLTGPTTESPENPNETVPKDPGLCDEYPGILACEKVEEIEDVPLPDQPKLYERKYPEGMQGIYGEFKDRIKLSSMFSLAGRLLPNVPEGGACPSWNLSLDFGSFASFGTHDVAPPCWLWGVLKSIVIFSALLLARALIFGG